MMRTLFWKIKDIPGLLKLHRRMHTLAYANYDSRRDEEISLPFARIDKLAKLVAEVKAEREEEEVKIIAGLKGARNTLSKILTPSDPFYTPKVGEQMELF